MRRHMEAPLGRADGAATPRSASAEASAITAPTSKAGTKVPVACTMNPVTVGASAPPRYPPKFWMEPKDAVQWAGAATEAKAHDMPLAPPAKKTAAEMAITATTLLGVSAATKVNTAIATRPTMTGSLRELIGENPPAISLSVTQPAPMLPTT